jgi:predicted N-acetyltransferase YhbS
MITLKNERDEHASAIEQLLDKAFGEGRLHKTSQRLRDGQEPIRDLSLVALGKGQLIGTVRMWSVQAGRHRSLLLGPLAVDPTWQDQGVGAALMKEALRLAKGRGETSVILVGDEEYYGKFGFKTDATTGLYLPGPVDRKRFLANELVADALKGARGDVRPLAA